MDKRSIRDEIRNNTYKLSQSRLKKLGEHPLSFLKTEEAKKKKTSASSFSVGSYIEDVLYSRLDSEYKYKHKYYIPKESGPRGQMLKFCNFLLEKRGDMRDKSEEIMEHNINNSAVQSINLYKDEQLPIVGEGIFEIAYIYAGFSRDSREKVAETFFKDWWKWYHSIIDNQSKGRISQEIIALADKIVDEWLTDPDTKNHFKTLTDTEEIIIQANYDALIPFETDNKEYDILCTVQPDLLFLDHTKKTIRIVEIKTSDSNSENSFRMYRYDLQLAFYEIGLLSKYPDYDLLESVIVTGVYKSSAKEGYSFRRVYPTYISEKDKNISLDGLKNKEGKIVIEGLTTLLNRYVFHVTTDSWDHPMEYYQDPKKFYTSDLWSDLN